MNKKILCFMPCLLFVLTGCQPEIAPGSMTVFVEKYYDEFYGESLKIDYHFYLNDVDTEEIEVPIGHELIFYANYVTDHYDIDGYTDRYEFNENSIILDYIDVTKENMFEFKRCFYNKFKFYGNNENTIVVPIEVFKYLNHYPITFRAIARNINDKSDLIHINISENEIKFVDDRITIN